MLCTILILLLNLFGCTFALSNTAIHKRLQFALPPEPPQVPRRRTRKRRIPRHVHSDVIPAVCSRLLSRNQWEHLQPDTPFRIPWYQRSGPRQKFKNITKCVSFHLFQPYSVNQPSSPSTSSTSSPRQQSNTLPRDSTQCMNQVTYLQELYRKYLELTQQERESTVKMDSMHRGPMLDVYQQRQLRLASEIEMIKQSLRNNGFFQPMDSEWQPKVLRLDSDSEVSRINSREVGREVSDWF